ncbi:hypothetical protein H8356DRAFT_129896 [Neocallimastix lanati (nom. inval.)]|nr:hypothetical protein H8356DRAFT_129896 [Neocallimastix sp. JGI-2020a]
MKDVVTERNKFFESSAQTQEQYINLLSKAIGNNQRKYDENVLAENFDKEFDKVQKEWMSRKEELNQLKKEELEMDTKRIENLIGNLDNVGLNNKKNEVSLSYVYIYIYIYIFTL